MCLAVPMAVMSVDKDKARVSSFGVEAEISVALLESVEPGDWVIVHSGFAIQKMSKEEAFETLEILKRLEES